MDLNNTNYYFSKQLSWLKFNKRVLEEAQNETIPMLERLKYLAITASNLDEFFMKFVARLKDEIESECNKPDTAGFRPKELFQNISQYTHEMIMNKYNCFNTILPKLENYGIFFVNETDLNYKEKQYLDKFFKEVIFPVITTMAIDECRSFPLISNLSLNLGICLKSNNNNKSFFPNKEGKNLIALVPIPSNLPRIVEIPTEDKTRNFMYLEQIIQIYIDELFSGYEVESVDTFRITRNADVDLQENPQNLLIEMENYIKRRKWGFPVRLETNTNINQKFENLLIKTLNLNEKDIYAISGPIDLTPFFEFRDLENYDYLRFDSMIAQPSHDFHNESDIFSKIKSEDALLHLPYESFDPVIEMVQEAANDQQVLAIKQTLYRVSGDSPIIKALATAAENGKQVTVLVELKARYDEQNNIEWGKKLEEAGCHVIYGLVNLKVHAKLLLIIRSEKSGIKRYVHMSTGNYNNKTAKLYTDIGMFTSKKTFGTDISNIFNILTGYSVPTQWKKISVAPLNLRERFLYLIDNEINQVKSGKKGRIIAKMNALVDKTIIKKLYEASSSGVKIDLIVRGICCLRPEMKGISQNIKVMSIIGRLLEHSRIYFFNNGSNPLIFLSSADWRSRNLDKRVEVLFPVEQKNLKKRIKNILEITLKDNVKARRLLSNGEYKHIKNDKKRINSQIEIYQKTSKFFQEKSKNLIVQKRL